MFLQNFGVTKKSIMVCYGMLWYVMVFSGVTNGNSVIKIVTIKLQIADVFLVFIDGHVHLDMFYTRCYNVLPSVFFAVFELQSD